MPQITTKRRVPHSAVDMFDLVADVEQYPRFVPFCRDLRVLKRDPGGQDGTEVLVANMTVAYKLIKETFTSRVTLDPARLRIHVKYLNGPFTRMENRWEFHPIDDNACEVEFFLAYEFKSRALALVMGSMFDAVFRRFASAFEQRADVVYGPA
jgi:coenzyme Q-binding protein COQ10